MTEKDEFVKEGRKGKKNYFFNMGVFNYVTLLGELKKYLIQHFLYKENKFFTNKLKKSGTIYKNTINNFKVIWLMYSYILFYTRTMPNFF